VADHRHAPRLPGHQDRGFGRSCGVADSRGDGCARGWTHLFDQRFEARDTQYLLGLLVDAGIAKPGSLGVTGVSGGSAQALELAYLRNRVRLPDGRFALWRSPNGRRLSISAAFPTWTADDLIAGLFPNGRSLDYAPPRPESLSPLGVPNHAYLEGLVAIAQATGFVAPRGADPTADVLTWKDLADAGEPFSPGARAAARQIVTYHSTSHMRGIPAPLLVQNGWNDDVFPVSQALRVYNSLRRRNAGTGAPISLQLIDTGHSRGGSHLNQERTANDQAARFFDFHLRRRGSAPQTPAPGTAILERTVGAGGFTLLGRPTVEARVATIGPFGQLDSHLWDIDPIAGTQLLVTRGAYRLTPNQRGDIVFQLNGNGYRFLAGHRLRLELAGRDDPYLRPSNGTFSVAVSRLSLELPVAERPNRARRILQPRFAIDPALLP
jgi:hypothetical protein